MDNWDGAIRITDDLERLLEILPAHVRRSLRNMEDELIDLIEVVLDLGRRAQARFPGRFCFLTDEYITRSDLQYVIDRVGMFGNDNRAGIERTLHRISAIRNRLGDIVGLTCRVGRAVYGMVNVIRDVVESGKSILLLGRPGVGKTTLLREIARVMADEMSRRVVIVDTSNEIAGDGDIPHPGIGMARRMQVPQTSLQHALMIEAVENHMPEVVVVDEIGTEQEAYAARTIAERGVILVATAHGNTLENLVMNPTLSDLVGGIQAVTLSDEEARRRQTQKTVLERKSPPTFDVVVEIQDKKTFVIHSDVAGVVDRMLRGLAVQPEIRVHRQGGVEIVQQASIKQERELEVEEYAPAPPPPGPRTRKELKIYPYAISRNRLERAIRTLGVSAEIVRNLQEADLVLTLKSQLKKRASHFEEVQRKNIPIEVIKSNTVTQLQNFLRSYFEIDGVTVEDLALREAEEAIRKVIKYGVPVDLAPQNRQLRRMQHKLARSRDVNSRSVGSDTRRHVRLYP